MPHLLTILVAALLAGCSLLPSEHRSSEAVKSSEATAATHETTIKRSFEAVPEFATRVAQWATNAGTTPLAIREAVEVHDIYDTNAGSRAAAQGSSLTTLPMGTKLILLAIGGFLLLALVWAIRRSSVAANAAFKAGDEGLAKVTNHLSAMASTSTNPEHLNILNSLKAEVEKARGQAAAKGAP